VSEEAPIELDDLVLEESADAGSSETDGTVDASSISEPEEIAINGEEGALQVDIEYLDPEPRQEDTEQPPVGGCGGEMGSLPRGKLAKTC